MAFFIKMLRHWPELNSKDSLDLVTIALAGEAHTRTHSAKHLLYFELEVSEVFIGSPRIMVPDDDYLREDVTPT